LPQSFQRFEICVGEQSLWEIFSLKKGCYAGGATGSKNSLAGEERASQIAPLKVRENYGGFLLLHLSPFGLLVRTTG